MQINDTNDHNPRLTDENNVNFMDADNVLNQPKQSGRKSMGRRVSFAATAKVRLFEKSQEDQEPMQADPSPLKMSLGTPTSKLATIISPPPADTLPVSRIPVRSPVRTTGNFEVDLLADDKDSLDSFCDDEEAGKTEDDTMDFTTCVGGIAPATAFERLSEANTMDFTGCVGRILSEPGLSPCPTRVEPAGKYDELENDTMDLTACIGGLLPDGEGSPMQLTRAISSTIHQQTPPAMHPAVAALKLTSPSPFLIHSPLSQRRQSINSDVSMIDNIGQPDFTGIGSPSAEHGDKPLGDHPLPGRERSAKPQVGFSAKNARPLAGDSNDQWAERRKNGEEDPSNELFQSLINTEPSAALDLKEFLASSGIRFMDSLTSLGRRETTGRPRDSDTITPAKHRYLLAAGVPERLAVDERCAEMVQRIVGVKAEIGELEGRIGHFADSLPAFTSMDQEEVKARMKTCKSVARLLARLQWYEWRAGVEAPLLQTLRHNLSQLAGCHAQALQREVDIDAVGVPLVRLRDALSARLSVCQAEEREREAVDWTAVNGMNVELQKCLEEQAAYDRELEQLAVEEEQLRAKLAGAQEEKRRLKGRLEQIDEQLTLLEDSSDMALREVKSRLALMNAVHSWQIKSIQPMSMVIEYRHGVQVRFELSKELFVPSVQVHSSEAALPFLRLAAGVVKVESNKPLLRALLSIVTQLDRLYLFDRSLQGAASWVQPLDGGSHAPDVMPLSFFSLNRRTKATCQMRITMEHLFVSSVSTEYGDVSEERVRECVDGANLAPMRFQQLSVFLQEMHPSFH